MKDLFFAFIGIAFIAGSVIIFLQKEAPISGTERVVRIGETRIIAHVSDTLETRGLGLSGRISLEEGRGMLFVFDTPGRYGFWMKDMNLSIDIIYISDVNT